MVLAYSMVSVKQKAGMGGTGLIRAVIRSQCTWVSLSLFTVSTESQVSWMVLAYSVVLIKRQPRLDCPGLIHGVNQKAV